MSENKGLTVINATSCMNMLTHTPSRKGQKADNVVFTQASILVLVFNILI